MFNKLVLETKSHTQHSGGFYTYYDHYTNDVIGGVCKLLFDEEIRRNVAVQTAISNQLGIINNADLQVLKTDKDNTDQSTDYQPAVDFLNILKNPNTYPSPKNWKDILKGIYETYISKGIVALVLVGGVRKEIRNIEIAPYVKYNNNNGIITYNIQTTRGGYNDTKIFAKNEELNAFVSGDDVAIIFGNFDNYTKLYKSPLESLESVILWNNYIINSSRVFYENSCRPSSIITVKFMDNEGKIINDDTSRQDMIKIIADIKTQIKGTQNTGKVILPSQPNLDITVTPLSITQNANDIKEQLELTKKMIYSHFTGTNTNVIEGVSEYANNRNASLREFYDGTVSIFEGVIISELNTFLTNWLQYLNIGQAIDRQGIYLNLDKSTIQLYKDLQKEEINTMYAQNQITVNEARQKKGELDDNLANLPYLANKDKLLIELSKSNLINSSE